MMLETGFAVVRVKPLGAGAGGGEVSALGRYASPAVTVGEKGVRVATHMGRVRDFLYPHHIVSPSDGQAQVYAKFMQPRINAFLDGINVNVMCYGQTGSGKTHTMFGPPNLMRRAGCGKWGAEVADEYGICPRGIIDIMGRVEKMKERDKSAIRYLLTVSAVEVRFLEGNRDMLRRPGDSQFYAKQNGFRNISDVIVSKTTKPPTLWGQREMELDSIESLLELFRAIASRSTTGTKMNDSSSRSHCFVYLNFYAFDRSSNLLRKSRFQFVDLAGSERMKDAHGSKNYKDGGLQAMSGTACNIALMMLSQRLRELSAARRKSRDTRVSMSSKTQFDSDTVSLLAESMSGDANSLIIVCVSSAEQNATQSINALDFGLEFSKLSLYPRIAKAKPIDVWYKESSEMAKTCKTGLAKGASKYALIRQAMGRAGRQLLTILDTVAASPKK